MPKAIHSKIETGPVPAFCAPPSEAVAANAPVYKPKSKPVSAYMPDYMAASSAVCPNPVIDMKLVTEKAAIDLAKSTEEHMICFAKGAIITPAAKDIFKRYKKTIKIV